MDINLNVESCESQGAKIKAYLLSRPKKVLTSLKALQLFGCLEFPKRVSELVRSGVPIRREKFITLDNGKRVKAYFIEDEDAAEYMKK